MITPYSTPLKTEYKPLGLEAFAQPLSQMSEKLETAKSLAANVDFEMSRLNQDDPRSKELMELLNQKSSEIASNLGTSKNYRQATQQIMDLNKMFNKDPELQSIKSNYEGYKKMEQEHKDMVAKGTITQRDLDTWRIKTLGEFKGTDYKQKSGEYTAISLQPRMENMEEAMRKESLDLAKMAVVQHYQNPGLDTEIEISPGVKQRIETKIDYRDLNQVAGEIQRMLATSDKYKDWVQQDADYTFYANSQGDKGEEFRDNVIDGTVGILQTQLAAAVKSENPEQISAITAELNTTLKEIEDAKLNSNEVELAKKYYKQAANNRFAQLGVAAADLVDFKNVGRTITEKVDESVKKKLDASTAKIQDFKPIDTNIATADIDKKNIPFSGGSSTSSVEEEVALNNKNTYERIRDTKVEMVPTLKQFVGGNNLDPTYNEVLETSKDIYVVNTGLEKLETSVKDINANIEVEKLKLTKAVTPEEKAEQAAKIAKLSADENQARLAIMSEGLTLENLIVRDIAGDEELTKLWNITANRDTPTFLKMLEEANIKYLGKVKGNLINPNEVIDPLSEEGQLRAEAAAKGLVIDYQLPSIPGMSIKKDKLTTFSETLMKNYRENISSKLPSGVTPLEAIGNENLDKYTGGVVENLKKNILANQGGDSKVDRVSFNKTKGTTEPMLGKNNYDLNAYNQEFHYVGNNQDGTQILRYVLKREYQNAETAKSAVASAIRTQKQLPENAVVSDKEINAWKAANPTDIYITPTGQSESLNIAAAAKESYVQFANAMLDVESEKMFDNVNNFAAIHLISDPARRIAYTEMAGRLQDAVENKYTATELIQAPAAYSLNQDGTQSGFVIRYKVESGEVVASINKVTIPKGGGKAVYGDVIARKTLDAAGNLPTQLVAMDLMYGTGAERDLVQETTGWQESTFVPAFKSSKFTTVYNKSW